MPQLLFIYKTECVFSKSTLNILRQDPIQKTVSKLDLFIVHFADLTDRRLNAVPLIFGRGSPKQKSVGGGVQCRTQTHKHIYAGHRACPLDIRQILVVQPRHIVHLPLLQAQLSSAGGNAFSKLL